MKGETIFFPKWIELMPLLEDNNLYKVAFKINLTYSHASKVVQELENLGFLTKEKLGRELKITFTERGLKMKEMCVEMHRMVKIDVPKSKRNRK